LQEIDGSAFPQTLQITVDEGNHHFQVSGNFLLDSEGRTAIRYCGHSRKVNLNRNVEILGTGCFFHCKPLSSLTFESGSRLTRIEARALEGLLTSLCLPASVQKIDGSALAGIPHITIEDGNRHFRVSGDFLLDFAGVAVVRYFGFGTRVRLKNEIEIFGTGCFSGCESLSSLAFESGSKLTRIEARAFSGFSSLKSILIPQSVLELAADWDEGSSLRKMLFESALSLRGMMERMNVDLSRDFRIDFLHADCSLDFLNHREISRATG
jgi:hypothetical protein